MTEKSRFNYETRIKELERRTWQLEDELRIYRGITMDIFTTVIETIREGKQISQSWIVSQMKRAMR